jgi:hypothetical protein
MKHSRLVRWTSFFLALLSFSSAFLLVSGCFASTGDIQYFGEPEMDFWKEPTFEKPRTGIKLPQTSTANISSPSGKAAESTFPWKKYLDSKNDEFFREGDYLPPPPFMEIARNPSDENIDNWFKYIAAKNEIARRLQTKLTEYAQKNQMGTNPERVPAAPAIQLRLPERAPLHEDAKRLRLRLYFDSKCPHCAKMIQTAQSLSQRGYWIELKQIDQDFRARERIPFPVSSASGAELKQYQIESVPLLLVGDLKSRTYFKIQGYQTEESVLRAFSEFKQSKQKGGLL